MIDHIVSYKEQIVYNIVIFLLLSLSTHAHHGADALYFGFIAKEYISVPVQSYKVDLFLRWVILCVCNTIPTLPI